MKRAELKKIIADICSAEFAMEGKVELNRPEEEFGDFSTNIAMQIAGKSGKNPRDIAEMIIKKLKSEKKFSAVSIAGPGFINISLSDGQLFEEALSANKLDQPLRDKSIVCEYSDPNPFKALHAGHLYTTLVGDAIANILETAGAKVHRVNFGGDVGLHAAKAMWAILRELGGENPKSLDEISTDERASWISQRYTEGHAAYEADKAAKAEIKAINKRIYKLHEEKDKTSPLAQVYWTCRQWSYEGFDELYERLGVKSFEKYYPESEVTDLGLQTIKEHTGGVYKQSDGAVVFEGEPYGLFTQVFITNEGLVTYAGKDVGLIIQKDKDFSPDTSYIITDAAQKDQLRVVMKSVEQFAPELVQKTVHKTHGRITLPGGKKMSSRAGDVVMAEEVLATAKETAKKEQDEIILGAVRYSFLKNRVGSNIVYDAQESVSHEGNSGPYLQYALVRARSILAKSQKPKAKSDTKTTQLDKYERSLARKLSIHPEAFEAALQEYSPHHICNYLYELAQVFNGFYENSRVIEDPRSGVRGALVESYEKVLSAGLDLLGMPKPNKM